MHEEGHTVFTLNHAAMRKSLNRRQIPNHQEVVAAAALYVLSGTVVEPIREVLVIQNEVNSSKDKFD
jgi:hypothetical protein